MVAGQEGGLHRWGLETVDGAEFAQPGGSCRAGKTSAARKVFGLAALRPRDAASPLLRMTISELVMMRSAQRVSNHTTRSPSHDRPCVLRDARLRLAPQDD